MSNEVDSDEEFSALRRSAIEKKKEERELRTDTLMSQIETFEKEEPFSSKRNIISFWMSKKSTYPSLFEIAMVVYGTPATQNSVERLFSAVKFILNDNRLSLSADKLENILLLRCNSNMWV